jgi:uncharacterized protein YeaO (DUF488 family)
MNVQIERIYGPYQDTGQFRILVDRLWPRGVSKQNAHLDEWFKDIAPTTELRVWFGHKPEHYAQFRTKYLAEIAANPKTPEFIQLVAEHQNVTLLYGAKDTEHNQATVLRDYLINA